MNIFFCLFIWGPYGKETYYHFLYSNLQFRFFSEDLIGHFNSLKYWEENDTKVVLEERKKEREGKKLSFIFYTKYGLKAYLTSVSIPPLRGEPIFFSKIIFFIYCRKIGNLKIFKMYFHTKISILQQILNQFLII